MNIGRNLNNKLKLFITFGALISSVDTNLHLMCKLHNIVLYIVCFFYFEKFNLLFVWTVMVDQDKKLVPMSLTYSRTKVPILTVILSF